MPETSSPRVNRDRLDLLRLLVFDLDGVITSESGYWETARRAVLDLLTNPEHLGLNYTNGRLELEDVISPGLIARVKNRAVNSNWDLAFVALCLHLLQAFDQLATRDSGRLQATLNADAPLVAWQSDAGYFQSCRLRRQTIEPLFEELFHEQPELSGVELLEQFSAIAVQRASASGCLLNHRGPLWDMCHELCQSLEDRKRAVKSKAESVLPVPVLVETIKRLVACGRFTLGVATGRPRQEAVAPLQEMGLISFFDPDRIVTFDDVIDAELECGRCSGSGISLGKPHPFALRKAIEPEKSNQHLVNAPLGDYSHVAFVGDTASDVIAAQRAGVLSIGVLTGVDESFRAERASILKAAGCSLVLSDVSQLPGWVAGVGARHE